MNFRKRGTSVPSLEISKVPAGTGFILERGRTVSAESASNGKSDWDSSVISLEDIRNLAKNCTPKKLTAAQNFLQKHLLGYKSTAESRQFGEDPTYILRKAKKDNAKISFDTHNVGDILQLDAKEDLGMLVRRGGFLAAQIGVIIDKYTIKNKVLSNAMGYTPYMQRIHGNGTYWLEIQGDPLDVHLEPGEEIIVDPLKVVAFTENVSFRIDYISSDRIVRNAEGRDYNLFLKAEGSDGIVYFASLPQKDHNHKENN